MAVPNEGQVIASAWEAYVKTKPEDQIHDDYWLLNRMSKGAGFKGYDGGRDFRVPIEYAVNSSVQWYDDTESFTVARVDVFDEAEFSQKQIVGHVVMSELEKARNQGSGGKFPLLAQKMENLKKGMRKAINEALFSDGTGTSSKEIGGLQHLVSSTPTTGTVGGINRATFSFWRNQQTSGAKTSTSFDNLRASMRSIHNLSAIGVGGAGPVYWVTTRTVFEGYESLLTQNERFDMKDKRKAADLGYNNDTLQFKEATIAFDQDCPSGCAYAINPEFLKLAYLNGYWMKGFPAVDPANATIDVFKVMTIANLVATQPRRLGVVTAIT